MRCRVEIGDFVLDARVISLGGNAGANALAKFELPFDALNRLHEYGLIIADYHSYFNFGLCVAKDKKVQVAFKFQNKTWALAATPERKPSEEYRLHGVALSAAGKELMKVVEIPANDQYTTALNEFFRIHHFEMVECRVQESPTGAR